MIGIKNELLIQAHSVENSYIAFIDELNKLAVLEYPTRASASLIETLQYLASGRKDKIKTIQENLVLGSTNINRGLVRRELLSISRELTGFFTHFIEWIEGAQTQKVPWSLIPCIEFLSKEISPECQSILYCKNLYNYDIRWFTTLPEDLYEKLGGFNFISLPKLHKNDILLHTLIGHELFHPLCNEFSDSKKKDVAVKIVGETKRENPDINPAELFGQKELSKKIDTIMEAWERALHELMCDIACAHIFGPVALWAMAKYAIFSALKETPSPSNNFYPPWQYRFEIAWQHNITEDLQNKLLFELNKHSDLSDITNALKNTLHNYMERFNSTDGFDFLVNNHVQEIKIAYTHINELLPEAEKYIKSKQLNTIKTWNDADVIEQVPVLLRRICNNIPPNEIFEIDDNQEVKSKPAELTAIFLSGCIYQIYRESIQGSPGKNNTCNYHTLSRLLLKACEDSMALHSIG